MADTPLPPTAGWAATPAASRPEGRETQPWTHSFATYLRLIGAKTRADYQYRTSFFLFLLGQSMVAALDLFVVLIIFGQVDAIGGWSRDEVLLLYAITGTSFALGDLFISQVELVSRHIKAGTFDQFLLRPFSPLWQLSALEFAPRRFGRLLQPLLILVLVVPALDVAWTPVNVALVPVSIACGTVIFGALWVTTSTLSFFLVNTQEMANSVTYGGNYITQYPLDVLGGWLRRIFTFIVPLAFVSYFPAAHIVGQPLPGDVPSWVSFAGPAVAALTTLVAWRVWRLGLRHYRSTGS